MFNKSEAILKKMLVWNCHLGGMGPRRKGGKFFFLKVEIEEYDMLKKSAESFFFSDFFPFNFEMYISENTSNSVQVQEVIN